ncbi:MAG: hypothetical protein IJU91_02220 [Selenomonadaceae bacterium]|nr:hypothetical protein [Selenomonadaceae bacterium]
MAEFEIKIKVDSPIHLGSGQADVNLDAEFVHDAQGFPYFPAKRFKGLLYESAVEVFEMCELAGMDTTNLAEPEKIFNRNSDDTGNVSDVQIIVPNFYFKDYQKLCDEWKYLQKKYPEVFLPTDILNAYSSVRYQTQLKDGITVDGSLRNLRVLNAGVEFFGTVTVLNASDGVLNLIALALKNLSAAGTKRNRGFGHITCTATCDKISTSNLVEKFLQKAV